MYNMLARGVNLLNILQCPFIVKTLLSEIKILLIKMRLLLIWHKGVLVIFTSLLAFIHLPQNCKGTHGRRMRRSANYAKTRENREKLKIKSAQSGWTVKYTPVWEGNVTFTRPHHHLRISFWLGGGTGCDLRTTSDSAREEAEWSLLPARKPSQLSDPQPHCQSDTGDEATRLRYARILLAHCASLLRI